LKILNVAYNPKSNEKLIWFSISQPNIPKKYTSNVLVGSKLFLRNKESKFKKFGHFHVKRTLENKQFDPQFDPPGKCKGQAHIHCALWKVRYCWGTLTLSIEF
jgi:hypothetical protein